MKQIRKNTFETNSSSTHSLVICTEDELNRWKAGELVLNLDNNELITMEKAREMFNKDNYKGSEFESYFASYDEFITGSCFYCYLEGEIETYFTTPSGDKMAIIGKYGRDS